MRCLSFYSHLSLSQEEKIAHPKLGQACCLAKGDEVGHLFQVYDLFALLACLTPDTSPQQSLASPLMLSADVVCLLLAFVTCPRERDKDGLHHNSLSAFHHNLQSC